MDKVAISPQHVSLGPRDIRGADYEIVSYRPEFKSQVAELQRHQWGPDATLNAAYLEWKYERNPYLSTPLIYLALHGEHVVGMRAFCGGRWEVGEPTQLLPALVAEERSVVRQFAP